MGNRFFALAGGVVLSVCASLGATAQLDFQTMRQFQNANPDARFNDNEGTIDAIYGTVFSTGATPLESAWNHINRWEGMFGEDIGELVPNVKENGEILQGVMYNRDTGIHKFYTFRFNQEYQGMPVFRSGVGFLVRNQADNPLVLSGFQLKDLAGFNARHGLAGPQVTNAMLKNVRELMDINDIEVSGEELVIWAGVDNARAEPELAVVFMAQHGSVQTYPDYQKELFVASVKTGRILLAENQIHSFTDIDGTVSGRATDGIRALECDPESPFRLPYAEVSVVGGNSTFADENGDFTIPHGGNSQVTVRSRLRGRWFEVRDQAAGNTIPQIDMQVIPPGPVDFLHNPTNNQQFPTANVNGYLEANVVRDYVLFFEPTFPTINTQQFFDVNTNINSSCNAFYDGGSINFYRNGGGCNNTSFSDVVYHEYGHHLISVTGNGQGAMGEGTGDVMGVLIQDEPILGTGFQNCSSGIRNANNNLQYPCSGEIHFCGQLLSGCVWETRNELLITEPDNYRDISGQLFVSMLIVRGQTGGQNGSTINPFITILYLELDDNDGDIGNGTPHYQEIATGFGRHNMDAPPLDLLEFTYPNGRPELISPGGGVAFIVEITGLVDEPQSGTGVLHVDRGSGFEEFPMAEISENVYEANFPASDCGTELKYYVSAETTGGSTDQDPSGAPDVSYRATSAAGIDIAFHDDFEINMGWTVSGNASTGQWQRGVPVGGGQRGDPPTDADGSGRCYLTGNQSGDSDVDDGSTILTSPIMDASAGGGEYVVSYWRWYSNNFGADPENDIFVVDISNNGGSTWTNLETVGPSGTEVRGGWFFKSFRIADFVQPTDQMRLRFNASDLNSGSVVEAGVDGVQIQLITCDSSTELTGFDIVTGTYQSGDLPDLVDSDDSRLHIESGFGTTLSELHKMEVVVSAVTANGSPTNVNVSVEGLLDEPGGIARIALRNWNTGQFETVGSFAIGQSDTDAQFNGLDASKYVDGSGAIDVSIKTIVHVPFFAFTFDTGIDQVGVSVN